MQTITDRLLDTLFTNQGFTFNISNQRFHTQADLGFAVGCHKTRETRYYLADDNQATARREAQSILRAFVLDNLDLLTIPGNFLGAWFDGALLYVDVATIVASYDEATALARANDQKAFFSFQSFESVEVN